MRKITATLMAALCLCACRNGGNAQNEPEEEPMPPIGFRYDTLYHESYTIKPGDVFGTAMEKLGVDAARSASLLRLADSLFDVRKFRAGNVMDAYMSGDSTSRRTEYVTYAHNRIRTTVFQCGDSLAVWDWIKPVEKQKRYADVTIKSSLWNDMIAAGASPELIMELADIYQWSVNMFCLQPGDRFRSIYTQSVCEDEVISIDTVHFCIFNSGATEVGALRYTPEGEKTGYWGKDGVSLKKMFLKAPLRYNRISSGFTYHRVHPITGKVRAHTAVDYAAPTGTPVHAIGDGVITRSSWDSSGGGNYIKIKHPQGYESGYMHLSRYASGIRPGVHVSQGQLIGYVGSTGRSTGPHLDFRMWLKGKPVNPMTLNSPSTEPLAKKYREDFGLRYEAYISLLADTDSLRAISASDSLRTRR